MDRPERWEPVSSKDPIAAVLDIREAYYRLIWFIFPLAVPVGAGMAITENLPVPAATVGVIAVTVGLVFAVVALWRTGRPRRRADAVCLVLGWAAFFAYLIRAAIEGG